MFYQNNNFIDGFVELMKECNKVILEIYDTDFDKEYKDDNSPLTIADTKTNKTICEYLKKLNAQLNLNILIISEEIKNEPYENRKNYQFCWIVDPIDGTKEFINKNGQFTVNIGLADSGVPVFGIVSIPVSGEIYWGAKDIGSFKLSPLTNITEKLIINNKDPNVLMRIVSSNSHLNEETKNFILQYTNGIKYEEINIGSSIKLLWIAENKADIYPRLAPTSEWDICASHAIVKYAGGKVLQYGFNEELKYNKENLLNPYFVVSK
jgi:3'(2'), 5'-bisphosphate nucleotidase